MGIKERIQDEGYKNWMKMGIALDDVKQVLEILTCSEITRFHNELKSKLNIQSVCTVCTSKDIEYSTGKDGASNKGWRLTRPCPISECFNYLFQNILHRGLCYQC